jgi:hypothetical protein
MKIKIVSGLIMLCFIHKAALAQEFNEAIKLNASDSLVSTEFGIATDISGNFAIAGADCEIKDEGGSNPMDEAGAAYIFERDDNGNWNQVKRLVASDRDTSDRFGNSVSISGNFAMVGAPYEDEDALDENTVHNAGSVYIFKRNGYGNWNEIKKIVPSDRAAGDLFGYSVDISGNYAIVGAAYEDEDTLGGNTLTSAGSAYIFECDEDGTWNEVKKLVAHDRAAYDFFGISVSISGNYAIVGAAYEDEDTLGGNTLDGAGSVYIFERNENGNWKEVQKLVASDRAAFDYFGYSVSISGNYAIAGAIYEDEDPMGENTMDFAGSAYIFERSENGNWDNVQKIVASDRAADDNFGNSVDISGNYALVGSYWDDEDESGENTLDMAGSAYVFKRNTHGNWNEVQKLVASDRFYYGLFGNSVGISGNYAIIGNNNDEFNNGSAYIFESCTPGSNPDPDNILENGDFESCILSPWSLFNADYLGVTINAVLVDGTCTLSGITLSADPQPWDAQLKQELSATQLSRLKVDSVYILSFDASAETDDRPCRISFEQSVDPWANIMNETIALGPATQTYSFEFVLQAIYADMQLSIQVGTETIPVTFDNVKIARKVTGPVSVTNQAKMKHVVLFPNPASDYVNVIAENGATVKLYNSMGFLIRTMIPVNNQVHFEVAGLPTGVYFVEIVNGENILVNSVLIQ